MNSFGIFIFTKNRPDILASTLYAIKNIQIQKYIFDDSSEIESQQRVNEICLINSCIYLGKKEFQKFIGFNAIAIQNFEFMLKEPGHRTWNLGHIRNFALLFAKSIKLDAVLFMDDDIKVKEDILVEILLNKSKEYCFTGAKIQGLEDNSILGHLATELNVNEERTLSGGFLAFNPLAIQHYFLNIYNEDWIWIYLHAKGEKYPFFGSVFQDMSDPYLYFEKKILQQEIGELIIDGMLTIKEPDLQDELVSEEFWLQTIEKRNELLTQLTQLAITNNKHNFIHMITLSRNELASIRPVNARDLFKNYYNNLMKFTTLYNRL